MEHEHADCNGSSSTHSSVEDNEDLVPPPAIEHGGGEEEGIAPYVSPPSPEAMDWVVNGTAAISLSSQSGLAPSSDQIGPQIATPLEDWLIGATATLAIDPTTPPPPPPPLPAAPPRVISPYFIREIDELELGIRLRQGGPNWIGPRAYSSCEPSCECCCCPDRCAFCLACCYNDLETTIGAIFDDDDDDDDDNYEVFGAVALSKPMPHDDKNVDDEEDDTPER